MERITTLLDKIRELNARPNNSVIEIDLMMDYAKVLYADLLEWRSKVAFTETVTLHPEAPPIQQVNEVTPPNIKQPTFPASAKPTAFQPVPDIHAPEQTLPALSPAGDIRQRIGINDKYQYISELFGNNKEAYEEVITEINSFETEEEAVAWINQNVYPQFDWKEEMESIQSFYRTISDYFAETNYSK